MPAVYTFTLAPSLWTRGCGLRLDASAFHFLVTGWFLDCILPVNGRFLWLSRPCELGGSCDCTFPVNRVVPVIVSSLWTGWCRLRLGASAFRFLVNGWFLWLYPSRKRGGSCDCFLSVNGVAPAIVSSLWTGWCRLRLGASAFRFLVNHPFLWL